MTVVYLFKRDLRLEDNRGLQKACELSKYVVPVFVFDPKIIQELKAHGERLFYLYRAVKNLSQKIKLYCFYKDTKSALIEVFKIAKPYALVCTSSYSWSGKERNEELRSLCKEMGVEFVEVFDNFLVEPERVAPRKVFTPFFNEWVKRLNLTTAKEQDFTVPHLPLPTLEDVEKELPLKAFYAFEPSDCEKRLLSFPFEEYEQKRDFPAMDGTSKLSPCIRFGILSIRRIYQQANGKSLRFIKELAWREFWYHIAYHFPFVRTLEFQEKRRGIKWENREDLIRAFFDARTGYPIVDAGVRQLLTEKWLHNRLRMILASFLTKVLFVDWRIGEEFFKEHLLDYDEVVNVGNWQWSASVGADPKPLRLFNPMLQAQKYDPDCSYIKKYIPELKDTPCPMLHDPLRHRLNYHKPVVDYYERVKRLRALYSKVFP